MFFFIQIVIRQKKEDKEKSKSIFPMIREVRRERILDNRNKALKVQEKQAAMMEKVISITEMIMMVVHWDDDGGRHDGEGALDDCLCHIQN